MAQTDVIQQSGISAPFFMIRGVGKTWGTRYRKCREDFGLTLLGVAGTSDER
jgi:hypothetical protein